MTVTDTTAAPTLAVRPSNVRWRVLAILMFVSFLSYFLRGNLSIAAPGMIADLQLTEIQWGWVMSSDCENVPVDAHAGENERIDDKRRAAMLRLAKYTAPAMLAMLLSEKAVAQSVV